MSDEGDDEAERRVGNSASGNARVGAQIGFVHGDVHFYEAKNDSPEEHLRIGELLLDAGATEEAVASLTKAHAGLEPRTAATRLPLVLAMLSGRSISDIVAMERHQEVYDLLFEGARLGDSGHDRALRVVRELLVDAIRATPGDGGREPDSAVLSRFEALDDRFRTMITRHLSRVLTGVQAERIAAIEAADVEAGRNADGRRERARKFFEAHPEPPRAFSTPRRRKRVVAVVGNYAWFALLLVTSGLFLAVVAEQGNGVAFVLYLIALVAAAVSAWGAVATQSALLWARAVRTRLDGRSCREVRDAPRFRTGGGRRFRRTIEKYYFFAFLRQSPRQKDEAARWWRESTGLRKSLRQETVAKYGPALIGHPERLEWLAYFHARRAREQWDQGRLRLLPTLHSADIAHRSAMLVGAVIVAGALFVLGLNLVLTMPAETVLAFVVAITVGAVSYLRGTDRVAREHCRGWLAQIAEDELHEEQEERQNRVDYLSDRPSDIEVARWLDFDLRHVRRVAMQTYRLREHEVVTHLTLNEAAPACRGARMTGGPARYTAYTVTLFLLTVNGVRQLRLELNFLTGELGDHWRQGFHYDKVASASIREIGVRTSGRRRHVVRLDLTGADDEEQEEPLESMELRFQQAFQIMLVSRTTVDVLLESYDRWTETGEDQNSLFTLALESSGVSSATRVMESVAVEGRAWIEHDRRRYRWDLDPGDGNAA